MSPMPPFCKPGHYITDKSTDNISQNSLQSMYHRRVKSQYIQKKVYSQYITKQSTVIVSRKCLQSVYRKIVYSKYITVEQFNSSTFESLQSIYHRTVDRLQW